ncbi:hypothetical protein SYNPS1DRAFT_27613 [Syncephalis pseudoplumigaleata]|uniref:Gfd2/YDR514C-like C-terminal domain-containing protein n=1 Tax=Syncephalis pseudoplumigaleata TaxID=1712513 RepID=A0A4P9Z2F4_9FUNG|nr:hypothetical protein SYNPS1DRAFT_27613 [Syncephalis pseudoplumigaleata]|eukprot:RKP26707.1 hypothetical protein SYNPS1DRAFT_27613 [Syncephalis pseudoplumigaleata]
MASPCSPGSQFSSAVVIEESVHAVVASLPTVKSPPPEVFILVTEMQALWKKFLTQQDLKEQMLALVKVPDVYIDHGEWEFYLGVDQQGKQSILLTEGQARAIKMEIEGQLSVALPAVTSRATYTGIVPVRITNEQQFGEVCTAMKEYNRLYRHRERQRSFQQMLDMARGLRRAGTHIFMAVDIEAWERDQRRVLEVGWSMYDARRDRYLDQHYNVVEHRALRNGRYVPDLRDNFVFGKSTWVSLKEIVKTIQADLDTEAPLVFIGHDVRGDIKYLESIGVTVPDTAITLDTAKLHCAITGAEQTTSLGKMLDYLNIDHFFLHNAGNDAHYTLQAFLELTR